MKNNVLLIFNNQRIFDAHKSIVKNRIELIKNQFSAFGIKKFHEVNLNKFNFINNFQIGKIINQLRNSSNVFFIEPHNYHISKEIIEQLNNFIIKNNFNFAKIEKTSESVLLFNLRAYTEAFVMQRHLAIKFLESFNKSINFESNLSSFLASHNEKERLLKITPKNVRSIYRQACLTDLPIQICIETNSSCNFRCLMCPYHGGRQNKSQTFIKKADELPFDKVISLIDEVYNLERKYEINQPVEIVPFRRGEFLLYPKWKDVVSYIKEKGFRCYFSTNGSTWDDKDVEFVVDKNVDVIQVSLNGHDEESHKKLRLNGSFEKVYNTAKSIVNQKIKKGKNSPHVRLCNTINERNFSKVDRYVETWVNKFDGLLLGIENYATEANQSKNYKLEFAAQKPEKNYKRPPCGLLKDTIWINADGKFVLCLGKKLLEIGSVFNSSLKDLINSQLRKDIINDHSLGKFNNKICNSCQQWFNVYNKKVSTKDYDAYISCSSQNYFTKNQLTHIE